MLNSVRTIGTSTDDCWKEVAESILEGRECQHPTPPTSSLLPNCAPSYTDPCNDVNTVSNMTTRYQYYSTHTHSYDSVMTAALELCCHRFLHSLVLRSLPEYLTHYSTVRVMCCEVDKLLMHICNQERVGVGAGVDIGMGGGVSKGLYIAVLESKAWMDLLMRHGLALNGP